MTQKFEVGDLVRVGAGPSSPTHVRFNDGCNVCIVGSYNDLHDDVRVGEPSYVVMFPSGEHRSWYPESALVLVQRGKEDLIIRWRRGKLGRKD